MERYFYTYEESSNGKKSKFSVTYNGNVIYNHDWQKGYTVEIWKKIVSSQLGSFYPGLSENTLYPEGTVFDDPIPEEIAPEVPEPIQVAEMPDDELDEELEIEDTIEEIPPEPYQYKPPVRPAPPPEKPKEPELNEQIRQLSESEIVLDEMSIKQTDGTDNTTKHKIEDALSIEYPFISINGYVFKREEILSLEIDSTKKLPEITYSCQFSDEQFFTKFMPKDGDILSVMIRSKSGLLKSIRNDYVITGVIPVKKNNKGNNVLSLTLFGELFIPGLDSFQGTKAYKNTTFNVFKQIAKDLALGFSTNETETDDYQIWYKTNTPREFMNETIKNSWKDENSFYDWWIDIYYNLNFINVQIQLLKSEDKIDEAALIHNIHKESWHGNDDETTKATVKVFSNYYSFKNTSFFIGSWRPINRSSKLTFDYGTTLTTSFFEHNSNLYKNDEQKHWPIDIAPAYDEDKLKNHILLRGRATFNQDEQKDELAKANYNYNEIYKKNTWTGIQYTISNSDEDHENWNGNHHKNYKRAEANNLINKVELEKLILELNVNGLNLNVIRGDKMPIALIKNDIAEAMMITEDADSANILDNFYSGWFYIKGLKIKYSFFDNEEYTNNFSQNFIITRREWPVPEPIQLEK